MSPALQPPNSTADRCHNSNCSPFLGEPDAARRDVTSARELYRTKGVVEVQANALYELAELENNLGNINAARDAYDEARGFYEEIPNRIGEANVLRGLGDLEVVAGNLDLARGHYVEALHLFESENNVLGRSAVALGLGRIEVREELFAAAHDSLSRARDLFEQVKNLSGEAQTDFYDGAALLGLKQQAAAAAMFGRAASTFSALGMRDQADAATRALQQIAPGQR